GPWALFQKPEAPAKGGGATKAGPWQAFQKPKEEAPEPSWTDTAIDAAKALGRQAASAWSLPFEAAKGLTGLTTKASGIPDQPPGEFEKGLVGGMVGTNP